MKGQDTIYVDVREPYEYAAGHVKGARNLPLSKLIDDIPRDLPKKAKIILYCRTGNRSAVAAQVLHAHGYDVENGVNQATIETNYKHR